MVKQTEAEKPGVEEEVVTVDLPTPLALPPEFLGLPAPATQTAPSSSGRRKKRKTARIDGLRVHWARFIKRVGTESPSASSAIADSSLDSSQLRQRTEEDVDVDEVDEIVVDRDWTEDMKSSLDHSEPTPERSGDRDSHAHAGNATSTSAGHESYAMPDDARFLRRVLVTLRWELWPAVDKFFRVRFYDKNTEERYRREHWYIKKSLALWSAGFLVASWVLGACTIASPVTLLDKIWLYGAAPALTLPLVPLVLFDYPRDRPLPFQVILTLATWCWGFYEILAMYLCGFVGTKTVFPQGTKDFLATFYYTSALQTVALFGMKMNRVSALIGYLAFFIVASALILPYRPLWIRNLLNFLLYHTFLLFVHYMNENSERRLFILREQLKNQFKATQKAQINERKEADSKRRLTSYVFHDEYSPIAQVRVPLNTALLAVQNMEASCAVSKHQEIEFMALEGSLVMMSKVLNDMLDFNRMDSGRFEILTKVPLFSFACSPLLQLRISKPYAFHSVIRSLFVPLRMATDARDLELVTHLDKTIDEVARRAAYEAAGEDPAEIAKLLANESDGVVLGDAIRLRQIINNLASNACKFTPSGGRVTCLTRLVFPAHLAPEAIKEPEGEGDGEAIEEVFETPVEEQEAPLSVRESKDIDHTNTTASSSTKPPLKRIVVRIEVTDTGNGIPPREMAQGKLFSAFNQTEQGRQQGGKGTGLGLALVRQIVKLSGGRLGLRSKVGQGSTFWVELPLGVGVKVVDPPDPDACLTNHKHPVELAGPLSVDLLASRNPRYSPPTPLSSSVMQSLMDQGGLVELNLPNARDNSDPPVLTRTIGELSGGAQLGPPLPSPPMPETRDGFYTPPDHSSTGSTPTAIEEHKNLDSATAPTPRAQTPVPMTVSQTLAAETKPRKGPATVFEPPLIVLVVDDDRLTRTIMSRTLTRLGCNVSTAENGELALEMIVGRAHLNSVGDASVSAENRHEYDVVFLDNQMPIMSGLEVVSKLREMGRHDFVVGVTGNALINDQKEYFEAGVDHVLTKPVFEPSLVKMLTIADERRRKSTIHDA
ncbi:Tco5, signal transduction HAMP domain histidine kinase [Leucogyrophana mollusca]|uniref:Tco5, signal transduction HAMP domain histidine kinase n=1 Tax=Leucogyrophana mollusca TaxID=85980 RepID=A0ACB8BAW5_9AGAM|nr:Tco5, signal transduction HAMP domain histidine kinase [Leucogyrophana mollusca]